MPDLLDIIKARRSVRKYQAKAISQEVIEELLIAAGWAPSAHNAQPWRFIVLIDDDVKRQLAEAMAQAWANDMANENKKIDENVYSGRVERFATAPVLVVACITMEGMHEQTDEEKQRVERDLAIQSLGAALQNFLLAAQAKDLGACWFCAPAFCKETVRQTLKIPSEIEPQGMIAIGRPDETPTTPSRKNIEEYRYRNYWGT